MKLLMFFVALIGASAHAKALYNPEKQKALLMSMSGEEIVAHVCEKVTEDEVRKPTDETLEKKCSKIPGKLDLPTIERNLSKVKQQALDQLPAQKKAILDQFGAVAGEEARKQIEAQAETAIGFLKMQIESLDASSYLEAIKVEARTPTVEIEKDAEEVDSQIETTVILSAP